MAISLLGQKVGMTRVFSEDGAATPVTVIEVTPNRVSQVKTIETDGYNAVQLLAGTKKASRVNKALAGHYAKAKKRYNFAGKDATHGNSINHRTPGSIGQNQTPGRVFKGKKMAGHMGSVNHTTQNLTVVRVDAERNLLLVKGAVPGARGSSVVIKPAIKG